MNLISKLHGTLRRREFTGENRCPLCTRVNATIAAVLSATVGVVTAIVASPALGVLAGGAVLGLSAGMIYFRGYLVPGTPELTMKYFPSWLLRKFGKTPIEPQEDVELELDPVEGLQESGALEECPDVDDLCLTTEFRKRWHDRFDQVWARDDEAALVAQYIGVDENDVNVVGFMSVTPPDPEEMDIDPDDPPAAVIQHDDGSFEAVSGDDSPIEADALADDERPAPPGDEPHGPSEEATPAPPEGGDDMVKDPEDVYTVEVADRPPIEYPSREALFAEIAAAKLLEEEWDWEQWSALDEPTRDHLLSGLRLFLDNCPACGTALTRSEEPVDSCCMTGDVYAVVCEACDKRIFETGIPA